MKWGEPTGVGWHKEVITPVKEGGDKSQIEFGGSMSGKWILLGGVAPSAKIWMGEARESLRKQAEGWVTHRIDFLNIFLGNDCKVRFSLA